MSYALRMAGKCEADLNKCKKQQRNKVNVLFMHTTCVDGMEMDTSRSTEKCPSFLSLNVEKKAHNDDGFALSTHTDGVFWDSLIVNYVRSNELKQALFVYETMEDDESRRLACHTFTCLLKACAALKNPEVGAMLHVDVARKGLLETNIFIGSTLVDMYAKCGSIDKAQQVFDKLPNHNVVSWTSLITGYNKLGFGHEALQLVEKMHHAGLVLNSYTFVCSLKVCGNLGTAEKGAGLHVEIVKRGLEKDLLIGNTTVDMYSRCGLFNDAHAVLERLLPQDVIPWNALITGYVEHGKGEKALQCYGLMQHKGIAYDCITLTCCLKACGCVGAVVEGEKIYSQVCKTGMEKDHLINTFLVDMYAKCGSLKKAQEVLELDIQDAVSWTALISGYSKHGYYSDALVCFENMQQEGISPNICTLNCSLKACENIVSLEKGEEVYHEIVVKGFERDILASNSLIGLYARCGLLATAKAVFEKLLKPDMFAWNALIMGYVEHGFGQEALFCFEQMQQKDISYDVATLGCCLRACSVARATIKGHKIHTEVCKKGLDKELLIGNYLIDMYCACGLLTSAQVIIDKLPVRDIFSWNALLVGYSTHGHGEVSKPSVVLNYAERMQHDGVSPNSYTYIHVLKSCGSKEDVRQGRELHLGLGKQGLEKEQAVCVALIDFYVKCGLLEDALDVFSRIHVEDVASSTAILSGYIEVGLNEKALDLFEKMQGKGILPDAIMLVFALKACVHLGLLCKGQMIHAYIVRIGLDRDLLVSGTLICLYSKHNLLVEAQEVFKKLSVRDVVVWGALIVGYYEHGLVENFLECSDRMLQEGIPWDSATFVSILKACSCAGASVRGRELHTEIATKGLNGDLSVGNVLIDMYTKCGRLREALQVFDKLVGRDVVSWNAAITAYAQLREIENVMDSFAKMVGEGITPDWISFMNVLNACSHEGLVDEGWVCFRAISKGHGLVPRVEHYTCMVDILGRAGLIEQAGALIESMPLHPDMVGWTSVLGACQKWGNFELGRHAFDHAVLLDDNRTSLYVSMSNIIANV